MTTATMTVTAPNAKRALGIVLDTYPECDESQITLTDWARSPEGSATDELFRFEFEVQVPETPRQITLRPVKLTAPEFTAPLPIDNTIGG